MRTSYLFFLCFCFFSIIASPVFAQNGWQKQIVEHGFFSKIAAAPDGGLALVQSDSFGSAVVRRFSANGDQLWGRSIRLERQPSATFMNGLEFLPDGRLAVGISADWTQNGEHEYQGISFFSPSGDLLNTTSLGLGQALFENLFSTQNHLLSAGGFDRVDQIAPNSGFGKQIPTLAKLDFQGNLIWRKAYDIFKFGFPGVGNSSATDGGGFIFVGPSYIQQSGQTNGFALKIDPDGQPVWSISSKDWQFSEMLELGDGSFILLLNWYQTGHLMVKFNAAMQPVWAKKAPLDQFNYFTKRMLRDPAGGFYLILDKTPGSPDLVKLDNDGNILWTRQFGNCARLDIHWADINAAGEIVGNRYASPKGDKCVIFKTSIDGHIGDCFEKQPPFLLENVPIPAFENLTFSVEDLPFGDAENLVIAAETTTVIDFCPPEDFPVAHFLASDSACFGEKIQLNYDGNGIANADQTGFNWFLGNAAPPFSTEKNPGGVAPQNAGPAVISLVQTLGACRDTFEKTVEIRSPKLDLGPDSLVVCDENPVTLAPDSLFVFEKIKWDNGSSAPTRTVETSQTVWLSGFFEGCTATDSVRVEFVAPPDFLPEDSVGCEQSPLFFKIKNPTGGQAIWNGKPVSDSLLMAKNGRNVLFFKTAAGCEFEETVEILLEDCDGGIYAPTVFSPGSGAPNDVFQLFADPKIVQKIERLAVFDRWGELVFEKKTIATNDPGAGWDGIFRGKKMGPGVFTWLAVVRYIDGRDVTKKGSVTLAF